MNSNLASNRLYYKSIMVMLFLIVTFLGTIIIFNGPPHIALFIAAVFAAVVAKTEGYNWKKLEKGMLDSIGISMHALLIMMAIGPLVASWMAAGIVPTMIYYGLEFMSPTYFLTISAIICAIVSLAIGSSWTTMATVGLALFGIGTGLDMPPGMIVGAIVAGSYFGDKMSPFSDTTNLAPGVAGTDVFSHIGHMVWTTGPAFLITLVVFTVIGFQSAGVALDPQGVIQISEAMSSSFNVNPVLILPIILLLVMVKLKTPALPSLILATVIGYACAIVFQGAEIGALLSSANYGFNTDTGLDVVNSLVNRGGFQSMMWTVSLIIIALCFAGIIEVSGMLSSIVDRMLKRVKSDQGLVRSTLITGIFTALATGCQYTAIMLTGQAYKKSYEDRDLDPKNLSRAIEDTGTVFEPVVPWGLSAAYIMGLFGILVTEYAPYAILNWVNVIIAMIMATFGWSLVKKAPANKDNSISLKDSVTE